MAPRPYWKGYLKLSLVSCPIALSARHQSSERVSFRQINKKTGNRLRQQLVDDETREPVEAADKGKGYEVAKNEYLLSRTTNSTRSRSRATIRSRSIASCRRRRSTSAFSTRPYYITPNDTVGQEAFAVIREAMKGKGMVALGRVVHGQARAGHRA